MSQGLRGGQPGGPICGCGAREPGPYPGGLTLLSSGSEMVLAALGQEGAWTPVMISRKRTRLQAPLEPSRRRDWGAAGTMPRGRSFPQTYSAHSPTPRGRQDLEPRANPHRSRPGGRRKGSCPRVFSLLLLRKGRGPRAPGRPPPAPAKLNNKWPKRFLLVTDIINSQW